LNQIVEQTLDIGRHFACPLTGDHTMRMS